MLLDSPTKWNSTYLMLERFLQQYPALLAATFDVRVKQEEFKRLHRVNDSDINNIEIYLDVMRLVYQMTVIMCSETTPTTGLILPFLAKLQTNLAVTEGDEPFRASLKTAMWDDLKKRYQVNKLQVSEKELGC